MARLTPLSSPSYTASQQGEAACRWARAQSDQPSHGGCLKGAGSGGLLAHLVSDSAAHPGPSSTQSDLVVAVFVAAPDARRSYPRY